jgi:hypothetical protein
MTLLDQLRILRIPGLVKAILAVFALSMVALNFYIIYRGLSDRQYDFWIAAGASLLAAAAPALAVVAVLLVTESGMAALKRRMQQMLAVEIPAELRFTVEAPPPRLSANCKPSALTHRPNRAHVECGMYRDELWANYQLTGKSADGVRQILRMRVELVMKRMNVNILIDRESAASRLGLAAGASGAALGEAFQKAFSHTVSGATAAGYHFNPLPIFRTLEGGDDVAFVATRELQPEFVWDPSARLEFIQDLVLMMRSFVSERPDIFEPRVAQKEKAA